MRPTLMKLARGFLLAFLLVSAPSSFAVDTKSLEGRVVAIADGDTLTILTAGVTIKIRLLDIDAPESQQPFGTKSRQSLAELCFQRTAVIHEQGRDRYGRTLGHVNCAGVNANAEQVRRGMAWVFERYAPRNSPLYDLQKRAQAEHLGVWSDPAPIPPWEWRRQRRKHTSRR